MRQGDILIVGGYGAVGRVIAHQLAEIFPNQVVVAGRNLAKAEALAQESGGKIRPLQLDLNTAHEHPELLDNVAMVVMCLDVPDMRFVQQILHKGIHYIDITADDTILQAIEALDDVAKTGDSTAVLSVGLAPGITNLLTRFLQNRFDTAHQADIYILLGLGEAHGSAATRWTMQNLNSNYTVHQNGQPRQVGSFSEQKMISFLSEASQQPVYRFNFADQHVLTRTVKLPSISTWITFDPQVSATAMWLLRRTNLSKLLRWQWVEDVMVKLAAAIHHGSDKFVIQVEVTGTINGRKQTQAVAISGHGQSHATGLMTAQVVADLLANNYPSGVFHSEQLFEPLPFIQQYTQNEITFYDAVPISEALP